MFDSSSSSSSPEPVRSAAAVIVAGGAGSRMGGGAPKQYLDLVGVPVLLWSVRTFLEHPAIDQLVVVLPAADAAAPPEWLADLPLTVVAGGAERGDSVRAGLEAVAVGTDAVLVHDAARPLVSREVITRVLEAVGEGAAIAAIPVADTVKSVDDQGLITATVDRTGLWLAQTPQGFALERLLDVHRRAADEGAHATDDAGLFERYGLPVSVVEGAMENVKITRAADIAVAAALATASAEAASSYTGQPETARSDG